MKPLLPAMKSLFAALPFASMLLAGPVHGAERCVTFPVQQRLAEGVYLRHLAVRCETQPDEPSAGLQRARDWLALCQEAGGSARACAAAYADSEAVGPEDALRVASVERSRAIGPIASPLPAEPAPSGALRWETPRLLTNR